MKKENLLNEWFKNNLELSECINRLNSLKQEREDILKEAETDVTPALLERMVQSEQNLLLALKKSEELKAKSEDLSKKLQNSSEN